MDLNACLDILKARAQTPHDGDHCVEENASKSLALKVESNDAALEPEVEAMSSRELVQTFQTCQAKRVQVYQEFEKGFGELMLKEELAPFTQGITKQFASISNQINAIERVLRGKKGVPVSVPDIIRKVQGEEKEKLLLTSALLLEKMRLKRAEDADPDDSSIPIFEKSIESMKATHTSIIERINELLEELRYEDINDDENA
ncbi:unnamed protein product [Aphanomyces euteiches]|uniref:Uncharacterized protein n=1 Tax=Aphanomyces euteiches TaxID=100861 RepID=A0A6G0WU97_9STRA|nr:hypothetical protein Ae201684_011620 [Aphanomyces euteiches]KAH9097191.1 hypothetical protein Ae201684P_011915 [Aphanomyces euteiches]